MTAICGGGPSAAQQPEASIFLITSGYAATLLANAGGPWYALAAAVIGTISYNLTTNCVTDPPGYPSPLTLAEAAAILGIDILSPDYASGTQKIRDYVETLAWYALCH